MARTRSAKGEIVDFDLLKIRQKLQEKPISLDVQAREDFIDKKLRRRIRKVKQATAVADSVAVDSELLASIETPPASTLIDPPKIEVKPETKQKNRPPIK